jgi:hypothetical protein
LSAPARRGFMTGLDVCLLGGWRFGLNISRAWKADVRPRGLCGWGATRGTLTVEKAPGVGAAMLAILRRYVARSRHLPLFQEATSERA